jgi:crossover junction endodeoxyribonuclease RuvC
MRILGIDPGIATVGFGLVEDAKGALKSAGYGVITTPSGTSLSSRLDQIYRDVTQLIDELKPDAIACEELFFNTNITTGIAVAHGRGVILLACYRSGVPVFEYTPLQVKQAVVGYGRAEKNQVIDMVRRLLKLGGAPKPDDAADALAIAICHARSSTSLIAKHLGGDVCSTT